MKLKKIRTISFFILFITSSICNILWLFAIIILFFLFYKGFVFFKNYIKNNLLRTYYKNFFLILMIIFIGTSIRLFVFDFYLIPSSSMKNTLLPKDVILINKLKYGPRLPRSPFDIPIVNIGYYLNENAKKRIKEYWWPYKRLSGTTNIKQGDVIVFNALWDKDFILVKRCVAIAGDTLQIKNGIVYINGKIYKVDTEKHKYKFEIEDKKTFRI